MSLSISVDTSQGRLLKMQHSLDAVPILTAITLASLPFMSIGLPMRTLLRRLRNLVMGHLPSFGSLEVLYRVDYFKNVLE